MDETRTHDALVQFLYHELPAEDAFLTSQLLQKNAPLREAYADMIAGKAQLPKVQFNPSTDVLSRILAYSVTAAR